MHFTYYKGQIIIPTLHTSDVSRVTKKKGFFLYRVHVTSQPLTSFFPYLLVVFS